MGWLSGWDKRIKLTVDNIKIDTDLSHFPVTVILSPTHGDCVFDELTQDANRFKIAFTKSDGTTEMYGEIEKWDDTNESAIIHVSIAGWIIASAADTDFYMYYTANHADNTAYIGDIGSTPGHSVWDSNFKFVCHMVDATTSTVKDSTSNGNDGTKKTANEPVEATGKVGKGQDFDGNNDYITTPDMDVTGNKTFSFCFNSDAISGFEVLLYFVNSGSVNVDYCTIGTYSSKIHASGDNEAVDSMMSSILNSSTWYHVMVIKTAGDVTHICINGADDSNATATVMSGKTVGSLIGTSYQGGSYCMPFGGLEDEIRISDGNRTVAWGKATYNSLWDTLLTYGSEERLGAGTLSNPLWGPLAGAI